MNAAIVIQARMRSTRLPGKVLRKIGGVSVLEWTIRRARQARAARSVVVATSLSHHDDAIEAFTKDLGCACYRGSEQDVLDRFIQAGESVSADTLVRITADCPFLDPDLIDKMIEFCGSEDLDYTGCVHERSYPRGLDAEVVRLSSLRRVAASGLEQRHREHVTPYLYEHPELFSIASYVADGDWFRPVFRFCLDNETDLDLLREVHEMAGEPDPESLSILDVIAAVDVRPDIVERMRAAEDQHLSKNLSEGIRHAFAAVPAA